MANLVLTDNTQLNGTSSGSRAIEADVSMSEQLQTAMGEDLWEMWQQAGLEPINWQMSDFGP